MMCKRHGHAYYNVWDISAVSVFTKSPTLYPVILSTTSDHQPAHAFHNVYKKTGTRSASPQGHRYRHAHMLHDVTFISPLCHTTTSVLMARSFDSHGPVQKPARNWHIAYHLSPICGNTKSYNHSRSILIQSPCTQPARRDHKVSHFNPLIDATTSYNTAHHGQ